MRYETIMTHIPRGNGPRAIPRLLLAGALALSLAGCDTDELVAVEDPAQLQPGATATAAALPALVNGAFRGFAGGYSGLGDDAFLSASAVISDEFYWGDSFTTRFAADRRTLQAPVLGNISDLAFSRLHQARMQAQRAYAAIGQFEDDLADPDGLRSELRTTEGYIYITLSEGWCGGVPFSDVPDEGDIDPQAIVYGPALSTAAMNQAAVTFFDEAISLNPSNNLAKVGKARALLNLGRYAEAGSAVAGIQTSYVFAIEHSTNTGAQNNPITALLDNGRYSISNLEGGTTATGTALRPDNNTAVTDATAEGLNFRTAQDPRVPWRARPGTGRCFTSSIFCWTYLNYPNLDSDVPLASGVEARLIEAEAALNAGDAGTMMTRLNTLRANAASILPLLHPDQIQVFPAPTVGAVNLPALADPGDAAGRRALLFRERAFWLFGTGHRQGDLRRLVRNYGLPQTSVFPSGLYFRAAGSNFGTDVAYPVPFSEENNPEFVRSACVTSQA